MNRYITQIKVTALTAMLSCSYGVSAAPYVGFSIGQATIDDACDDINIPGVSCDDSDTSFKIYGGSKVNKNFGFEIAYVDMGQAELTDGVTTIKYEATGFNFSALGIIPVSNNVDIFGKAGLMLWDAEASISAPFNVSEDDNGTDITFGVGINFNASEKFAIRAEFEKFNNVGDEDTTGESSVTVLTVGAIMYF